MVSLVPIDLSTDALLGRTAPEIVRLNGGKAPSPTAWWSWIKYGRAGIRLPSVVVGGKRRLTTLAAFAAWIHATTAAVGGTEATGLVRTAAITAAAKRRESEIDAAIERIESRASTRRRAK